MLPRFCEHLDKPQVNREGIRAVHEKYNDSNITQYWQANTDPSMSFLSLSDLEKSFIDL